MPQLIFDIFFYNDINDVEHVALYVDIMSINS